MSMHDSQEYGYGFRLYNGKNSMNVFRFFEKHKGSYKELLPHKTYKNVYDSLEKTKQDLMTGRVTEDDVYDDLCSIFGTSAAVEIGNIIRYETNLKIFGFRADEECLTEETIMYVPSYPWEMSDEDKSMTIDKIRDVLLEYCKELGIDERDIDFQILSYYG